MLDHQASGSQIFLLGKSVLTLHWEQSQKSAWSYSPSKCQETHVQLSKEMLPPQRGETPHPRLKHAGCS